MESPAALSAVPAPIDRTLPLERWHSVARGSLGSRHRTQAGSSDSPAYSNHPPFKAQRVKINK